MAEKISETGVLFKFFGKLDPAHTLKEFVEECKALSKEDKHELAVLVAREQRLDPTTLAFPL